MSLCPVFILQFNFEFLVNDAGGEVELITSCIYHFWLILSVLGCVWKLWIIPLRTMFHLVFVSIIHLAIQFRVFDQWCRRSGRTNNFTFQLSWAGLKCNFYRIIIYYILCKFYILFDKNLSRIDCITSKTCPTLSHNMDHVTKHVCLFVKQLGIFFQLPCGLPNQATAVETSPTSHIVTIPSFPFTTTTTILRGNTAIRALVTAHIWANPESTCQCHHPQPMLPYHHPWCRCLTTACSTYEPATSLPITAPNNPPPPEPATSPPTETTQECPCHRQMKAKTAATSSPPNDDNNPNDNDNQCHVTAEGPNRRWWEDGGWGTGQMQEEGEDRAIHKCRLLVSEHK